jgi:two-component system cell cycle sensor histidine kinase/response regulator CckA
VALPAGEVRSDPPRHPISADERVVLLAEDDDSVRTLTRMTLEGAGFEVIEARDGDEALKLFHHHADRIGLALLDSLMPGFSGNQVLHEIRASHPGFPVVVCSGYIKETNPVGPEAPTAMLPKPWKPGDLIRVVESSLGQKS